MEMLSDENGSPSIATSGTSTAKSGRSAPSIVESHQASVPATSIFATSWSSPLLGARACKADGSSRAHSWSDRTPAVAIPRCRMAADRETPACSKFDGWKRRASRIGQSCARAAGRSAPLALAGRRAPAARPAATRLLLQFPAVLPVELLRRGLLLLLRGVQVRPSLGRRQAAHRLLRGLWVRVRRDHVHLLDRARQARGSAARSPSSRRS